MVSPASTSSYSLGGFAYDPNQQQQASGSSQASNYQYGQSGYFNPATSIMANGQSGSSQAAPPKEEKKGFFGKVFGAAKSLVKGATVGLGKAIWDTVTDPKKLLLAVGAVALTIAFPPAGIALAGIGVAMAGKTVVENGMVAAQAYASGNDAAAEAALENVGTGLGAGALSVAGVRASVGAAAAKGVNNGAAGSLNVSSKLAGKIKVGTNGEVAMSNTTAVRASLTSPFRAASTGIKNIRTAASAEGGSLGSAVVGSAKNLATTGRANLSTGVRNLTTRSWGADPAKLKTQLGEVEAKMAGASGDDLAALTASKSQIEGRIAQAEANAPTLASRQAVRDEATLHKTPVDELLGRVNNSGTGGNKALSLSDFKTIQAEIQRRGVTVTGERGNWTVAKSSVADDAATTGTPNFLQRLFGKKSEPAAAPASSSSTPAATTAESAATSLRSRLNPSQLWKQAVASYKSKGTTGVAALDAKIKAFMAENPTALRVTNSRVGTTVADINHFHPGLIPTVGGFTPYTGPSGQLSDNAVLNLLQANPWMLAGSQPTTV